MLRGVIAARLLGPGLYGAWNAIQIMMDYGTLAPAGTQQGLDQMVPPRIVAGDAAALARVKRAALFNISLLSGCLRGVACLVLERFGHSVMLESWGAAGIGAAMICAVTTNLAYYQTSIMRSHGDITTASGWMMIQGAVGGGPRAGAAPMAARLGAAAGLDDRLSRGVRLLDRALPGPRTAVARARVGELRPRAGRLPDVRLHGVLAWSCAISTV